MWTKNSLKSEKSGFFYLHNANDTPTTTVGSLLAAVWTSDFSQLDKEYNVYLLVPDQMIISNNAIFSIREIENHLAVAVQSNKKQSSIISFFNSNKKIKCFPSPNIFTVWK